MVKRFCLICLVTNLPIFHAVGVVALNQQKDYKEDQRGDVI